MQDLLYLRHYSDSLQQQVRQLLADNKLGTVLQQRYPEQSHAVQTDKALYVLTMELKRQWLKSSEPISKVVFDPKIHVINNALGTHTQISRVQGGKLKSKNEIRVAALLKQLPLPLLQMVVVHELAHLREKDHSKAFYKLCQHMQPDYHQLELDLRLFLTLSDSAGR
ncbi:M48 family metallopeptidase [Arsukibacterium sp.]|uniref:M48 metallopeptidase family protein n=1 Tax=Arsukibacterium sp. TaxID=1977258 RepID=UPI00356183C8